MRSEIMNKTIIMGNITKDIELKTTPTGKYITPFTVAVNERDKTEFVDCIAWEKTAEFIQRYFRKGSSILVEGKLMSREYMDKNDNKRKVWEVIVDKVHFAGGKSESKPTEEKSLAGFVDASAFEDELPF
jgi:single-strand DNA-binding protein